MKNFGAKKMVEFESIKVNHKVLFEFKIGQSFVDVAKGCATYKMNRGTFKTSDKLKDKKRLFYIGKKDEVHQFSDGISVLNLKVEIGVITTLEISMAGDYNRFSIMLNSDVDESFFGCGEQFAKFDLKGEKIDIWVSEHHSLKKLLKKFLREKFFGINDNHKSQFKDNQTYFAQPTFMSSEKYFVHCDSLTYASFEFKKYETVLSFREIPSKIYIGAANHFELLAEKLSNLLGKQPVLPEWTEKGVILAIQGGTKIIQEKVKNASENHIKISGVWAQDWSGHIKTSFGYQVNWNWTYDHTDYHDLKELIQELNAQNIKFLGYINTFLKEDEPLYLEAREKGFLVLNQKMNPYLIKSTTFFAGIVDLTNPLAYNWYKEIIKKNMIELGMSGWMADFGEYLPTDAVIHQRDAVKFHNYWPTLWAKCNYEAILETQKQNEVFFFSRAAYTKTLNYTNAMWSGDQHVDYSIAYGLPSVVTSALSMACVGIGITHSDIGGYTTIFHMKRDAELFMRWTELNVFSPLLRCHEGNLPESNVQFDDEKVIKHFANMSYLFNQLSPYLHQMKQAYYQKGIPVIRPMFYAFNEDIKKNSSTQFMYGSDLLIIPVLKPNISKMVVHLPAGKWVHLLTKEKYEGGEHTVDVPIGTPAAFYPEESSFSYLFSQIKSSL